MSDNRPVGLFDSGVGGISVMKELRKILPHEDLIYFADSANCPYGNNPPEFIRERARIISDFLLSQGIKLLVIACNTASVAALSQIRQALVIPVVGIEPAIKPATTLTRNGRVGVLATGVTLAGERFTSLVERFADGIEVYSQACPGLVEMIEAGQIESEDTKELLSAYLEKLLAQEVDTIVLGCTHYPFLRPEVENLAGEKVKVIDTGSAVSQQVARVLAANQLLTSTEDSGQEIFYTNGTSPEIERVIRQLWGDPNLIVHQINI
ncbi:MAG: glutamate racemase [Syntrophomonadaceae bacterium]|nr:glutamate racemase [Syntrophomonadaceae bacterium]